MNTISAKKRASGAALRACRIALLLLLLVSSQALASEITVEDWALDVGFIANSVGSDGAFFDGAMNPFSESHEVEMDHFLAGAAYDFAWDDSGGTFLIQSQLAADTIANNSSFSSASGRIKIRATEDLAVHVDASFDYNLPAHLMEAKLKVTCSKVPDWLFYEYREHDTLSDGIGSGTLSFSGDFVIPADELWKLNYNMELYTYDWSPGSAGQIATGSGNVSFTIQALPEPGTLSLAFLGSMMLLRHRPQQQKRATDTLPVGKGKRRCLPAE